MVEAFKNKIQRGETVLVLNPDHPSPSMVQFMGGLPIDAVWIDCEQGSADVETVENMARAARLAGLVSLVRVFSPEDWVIERFLFRGIDGLVVPRLDTAAQAQTVVDAVRYCFPKTHHEKLVVVQIESKSAIQDLAGFLRVAGIDVYMIGPVDLAKSLGFEGDFRQPEVQQAIDETISAIRAAGKTAGILVDRDNVRRYVDRGVGFLYAHANDFLAKGATDFADLLGRR
ncbi:MAG: aldolase/citrate lyase family protein [Kiloniellales bacterium]